MRTTQKLPVSVRAQMPVVCPPEKQGMTAPLTIAGMVCRALILFCAVLGLAWYVCDAFLLTTAHNSTVTVGTLALMAAIAVAYFTAMACSKIGCLVGFFGIAVGVLAAAVSHTPAFWRNTFVIAINACLERLLKRGYGGPYAHLLDVPADAAERGLSLAYADCITFAVGVMVFVLAAVFVPCIIRRTRIALPGIVSGVILMVVFTCNLNRSNWSFALIIASFAAILVLRGYDRCYLRRRRDCDNEAQIFAEETNDTKAQIRARIAAGGFAGLGMLLIAALVLLIPAAYTEENFATIGFIDEPMQQIRRYVTAYLRGDNPVLDELGYNGNASDFTTHSTDIAYHSFTGKEIFEVETMYNTNLYLRGWIATDYHDGYWHSADAQSESDAFNTYRTTFGTDFAPETMRSSFYRYVDPTVAAATDYTKSYRNYADRGFIKMQVNLRRVGGNSNLVYTPSYFNTDIGILNYVSSEPSELTYINYFDGIYTGRRFLPGIEYAFVAYATTMRDKDFMDTVSVEIAAYNLANLAMRNWLSLGKQEQMAVGETAGSVFAYTDSQNTFYRVTRTETGYSGAIDPLGETIPESGADVRARADTLTLANEIFDRYLCMSESELDRLQDAWQVEERYAEHVYSTYTDDTDSSVILHAAEHAIDTDLWEAAKVDSSIVGSIDSADYTSRHAAVMAVMEYLSEETDSGEVDENGKPIMVPTFTYTLEPTKTSDDRYDGVENFLTVTKEGYCVQFASAAVLMLRELGIPARYVEGYIVTGLQRSTDAAASQRYSTIVRDYHAHAWVEVYYDGIGWLNYEVTPAYADDMYETPEYSFSPIRPWEDPVEEEEEDTIDPEELARLAAEAEAAEARRRRMITACAILGVLLIVAAIIAVIVKIIRRTHQIGEMRKQLYAAVRAGIEPDSERAHAAARYLIDEVMALLAACGFAPETGELRDAYAVRLEEDFGELCPIALRDLFAAIAAEEFGSGMGGEALRALSIFREALDGAVRKMLPIHRRFYYRYIKHLL